MKKMLVILVGMLIASSAALAQTNQVLSRNAVGYVKVTIDKGDFAMLQSPFINLEGDGSYTVTNLVGGQIPNGSVLFIWDEVNQSYISENKLPFGWVPGTNVLDPGAGFFVSIPAGAAEDSYDLFMMGEVPDRFTAPEATVPVAQGFSMVGVPYPVAVKLTNTTLAAVLPNGSAVFVWDQVNQTYTSENRLPFGWVPGTLELQPGQAVFVQSSISTNWVEVKPYTWP